MLEGALGSSPVWLQGELCTHDLLLSGMCGATKPQPRPGRVGLSLGGDSAATAPVSPSTSEGFCSCCPIMLPVFAFSSLLCPEGSLKQQGRRGHWGWGCLGCPARCDCSISLPRRTHMQNIKDITSNIHFEAYRVKRLNEGQSSLSNGVADKELVANEM